MVGIAISLIDFQLVFTGFVKQIFVMLNLLNGTREVNITIK